MAVELAQELDALGHVNRVVALGRAADGSEEPELPVLVAEPGMGLKTLAESAWRLRRLVVGDRIEVVVAHGGWAAQAAAIALPFGGPLLVWQRILGFPPGMLQSARRARWWAIARRVDIGVALTGELEQELRLLRFTRPIWVIPNSRQPERFVSVDRAEEADRLRQEVGVAADVPIVGFVGHLVRQKRPDRALDVVASIRERGQPVHLVLAGDGPLRGDIERAVSNRGLGASVTLLGQRRDVERVLGGIDLLVLTSEAEGIPGVAIEAQMTGCPVVTFPFGGVAEVVDDGVTGVVLTNTDTEVMADRVVDLLRDADLRRKMGEEGRRRAPRFAASRTAKIFSDRLVEEQARRSAGGRARQRSGLPGPPTQSDSEGSEQNGRRRRDR